MIDLGYRVIYYKNHEDKTGSLLHETQIDGDKVSTIRFITRLSLSRGWLKSSTNTTKKLNFTDVS